jgi:hypothetical protein
VRLKKTRPGPGLKGITAMSFHNAVSGQISLFPEKCPLISGQLAGGDNSDCSSAAIVYMQNTGQKTLFIKSTIKQSHISDHFCLTACNSAKKAQKRHVN